MIWDYIDLLLLNLAKIGRKPLNENNDLDVFYEDFFTDNDDMVFNSGVDRRKVYKGCVIKRVVQQYVENNGTLLDIGCGVGDNLKFIYKENINFAGLEYSTSSLERARKTLPDRVELKLGSAVDIPYRSSFADMVLCIEVLEHIPDQYEALRDISRVMRPDGVLMLSVPYRRWFPSYYTRMGHIRHYTNKELQQLLSSMGFDIVEWLPNNPRWNCFANYCYLTCRALSLMVQIFGKRVYPHEFRFPFSEKIILDFLFNKIEKIKLAEDNLDYASLSTSTFVLCKKT